MSSAINQTHLLKNQYHNASNLNAFDDVVLRRYEDALNVTEAEPLIAYILSLSGARAIESETRAALMALIESELARQGAIHITKSTGLFLASPKREQP